VVTVKTVEDVHHASECKVTEDCSEPA